MRLITGINVLEKNTQAQLTVVTQLGSGDLSSDREFTQGAQLDIRCKRFGEEHLNTADSYHSLRLTQHKQGDLSHHFSLQSMHLILRVNWLAKNSQAQLTFTINLGSHNINRQGDLGSALWFKQRALHIRHKIVGEEQLIRADSYHLLGLTQHKEGDLSHFSFYL